MSIPLYQVDAFTGTPYTGNPAAVCLLEGDPAEDWMQAVAAEMNLSETAYVYPGAKRRRLRWFTPTTEVELCGHATLASAHVLWETEGLTPDDEMVFETLGGELIVGRENDGYVMDFPARPPGAVDPPKGLIEALGLAEDEVVFIGRNDMDYLVQLESATRILRLDPDSALLRSVDTRGVMVTARSDDDPFDFVSRFFAPAAGIDEDPVTGSAHTCLGPFWGERLGKKKLRARQVSPRGGEMLVRLRGDRVDLVGRAVTVLAGRLEPSRASR